jgi:hypothetical protein
MNPNRAVSPQFDGLLREIARRYRHRRWIMAFSRFGLALLAMTALLILALAAGSRFDVSPAIPLTLFVAAALVGAARWLLPPLRRPIDLRRIALYIDERHPELENRIISAVDLSDRNDPGDSAFLVERFFSEIDAIIPEISLADLVDTRAVARAARTAAVAWVLALGALFVAQRVWFPVSFGGPRARLADAPRPTDAAGLEVKPGDVRVRRGSNQVIWVTSDPAADTRSIAWRAPAESEWRTELLQPSASKSQHFYQYFNIQQDMEYRVTVGDRLSPVYRIAVWTPPAVDTMDLTLNYPEYLEKPVDRIANSGDIAAIEGTRVDFDVRVNKPIQSATIVFDSGEKIEFAEREDTLWGGRLVVARNDRYHIELVDRDGQPSEYHRGFSVRSLPDDPPKITVASPRGDGEANAIEEIPFELKVSDDFGLLDYGIEYRLAGGDPVRISLRTTDTQLLKAEGDHLLMLEQMSLAAGDFITWNGYATDRRPDRDEFEGVGDPYFLEVRPFRRTFSEAISNEGGEAQQQQQQQGGEGQEDADQKQIIIATWNLRRAAAKLAAEDFDERRARIVESQQQLLEQVQANAAQLLLAGDAPGANIPDIMRKAIDALDEAKMPTPAQQLSDALVHEQNAYREILRTRPNETEVTQTRQPPSARGQSDAEVDQLELERRRDFFEEASTQRRQQEQTEEILRDLRELSKRQQILNEEMAKLVSELETPDEAEREEEQRRLERLREEQQRNLSQLDEIAGELAASGLDQNQTQEQLQQARDQMNRSSENLDQERVQQARNAAGRALSSLNEAERGIEQLSNAAAERRMAALRDRMQDLLSRQDDIVEQTDRLREQTAQPGLDLSSNNKLETEELLEQKTAMRDELTELFDEANDLSQKAAQSQELMSRKLGEWIRDTGGRGIQEAIEQSEPLIRFGVWNAALAQEESVREQLAQAAENLDDVARFGIDSELEALQMALERLRSLDTPASSTLAAALNPRGQQGQQGEQGQGQQGEQGQGQQGEQGQGQQGQGEQGQGEQGQGQQGQGQQGQGQQGQGQQGQGQQGQGQQGQGQQGGGRGQNGGANPQRGGASGPGGFDRGFDGGVEGGRWDVPGSGPDGIRQFVESDYRRWTDALRDAEDLLPEDNPTRARIGDIRNEVDAMRRAWLRNQTVPDQPFFAQAVMNPMNLADAELREQIERRLNESEYKLTDEAEVPAQYAEKVADYFKALSELEPSRQ